MFNFSIRSHLNESATYEYVQNRRQWSWLNPLSDPGPNWVELLEVFVLPHQALQKIAAMSSSLADRNC